MAQAVGNLIADRYEVVRAIKAGGMGAVYEARDLRLASSPCALKEILDDAVTGPDAQYVEDKFKAEVKALATLDHAGIPKVRDFFRLGKVLYIVMEYVAGKSLDDELDESLQLTERPLEPEVVAGDTLQVLEILIYLHERQLLHRDIKPSNLVREAATGRVKLVDFGLARGYGGQQLMTMVGTPGYSAPEQLSGRADPRSDLYALGVTMHHLLTGATPRMLDLLPLQKHMPDYRPGLAAIIEKATRPKPGDRYASAQEMQAALREWCRLEKGRETRRESEPAPLPLVRPVAPAPPSPRWPGWASGAVLGLLGLGLGILVGHQPGPGTAQAQTPAPVTPLVTPIAMETPEPVGHPITIPQPDYDTRRPVHPVAHHPAPTPARPRRVVAQPTPVPPPKPLSLAPSYPVAHHHPKAEPTPTPVPPVLGSTAPPEPPPRVAPPPSFEPPVNRRAPLPPAEVLNVNLPQGYTIDYSPDSAVIHPGGLRGLRQVRRNGFGGPIPIRVILQVLEVDSPSDPATDELLRAFSSRFPGAHPIASLPAGERGVTAPGPGGSQSVLLIKTRSLGPVTRLCLLETHIAPEAVGLLRNISRGVNFR